MLVESVLELLNGVEPTFGDTSRYYQILTWMVAIVVTWLVPFATWSTRRLSKEVGNRPTTDPAVCRVLIMTNCVNIFYQTFGFAMVIPTSLQLCRDHGGSTSTSGLMVSLFFFSFITVIFCKFITVFVNMTYPTALKIYCVVLTVSTLSFAIIATIGPFFGSLGGLLLAQFLGGCVHGLMTFKQREHVSMAVICSMRGWLEVAFFMSGMLGLGLGPMFGSGSVWFLRLLFRDVGLPADLHPGAYAAIMRFLLVAFGAFVMLTICPAKLHRAGVDTEDAGKQLYRDATMFARTWNICVAMLVISVQDIIIASAEVYDVLVIELEYGWGVEASGMFVTMSVLCAIPLCLTWIVWGPSLGQDGIMRVRRAGTFVLLLSSMCSWTCFGGGLKLLLLGRIVFYSCIVVCISWAASVMTNFSQEEKNKLWSMCNICFINGILIEGFSRGVGPWLLRSVYESFGRFGANCLISGLQVLVILILEFGCLLPYKKYWY